MLRGATRIGIVLAFAAAAGLACQFLPEGERTNYLVNPGFEHGRSGWSWRENSKVWSDFAIVTKPVRTGRYAAHLKLRQRATDPSRPVGVYGVVQELPPDRIPEVVGGWVRVDRWEKNARGAHLYLQLVAIVWGDPRTPEIVSPRRPPRKLQNYQMRYYLGGAKKPAFQLLNARIKFVAKELPAFREWTHFEVKLREDIKKEWGILPDGHDFIRLLFEARWDNLPKGGSVKADVFFDDLYAH